MTMIKEKTFTMVAALCSVVSLSACDALMGPNDGDCQIDSEYRIRCDGNGGPTLHEPNQANNN